MPRNPNNPSEFIAGKLPEITYNGQQYYVDARLEEIRSTQNFNQKLDYCEEVWKKLSRKDKKTIIFEFQLD